MLTNQQTEDIAEMAVDITKTMTRIISAQFPGAGPGIAPTDDREFMGWIAINTAYHGTIEDTDGSVTGVPGQRYPGDNTAFFRGLAEKIPGGMKDIERFERLTGTGANSGN